MPITDFQLLRQFRHADFRKGLCIRASYCAGHDGLLDFSAWNYPGYCRFVNQTQLFRIPPHEHSKFDLMEFAKVR